MYSNCPTFWMEQFADYCYVLVGLFHVPRGHVMSVKCQAKTPTVPSVTAISEYIRSNRCTQIYNPSENSLCVTEWGIRMIFYFINSPMMLCDNSISTESTEDSINRFLFLLSFFVSRPRWKKIPIPAQRHDPRTHPHGTNPCIRICFLSRIQYNTYCVI